MTRPHPSLIIEFGSALHVTRGPGLGPLRDNVIWPYANNWAYLP